MSFASACTRTPSVLRRVLIHGGHRGRGAQRTEKGLGKRTAIAEYREQGRGGLGVINLKVTERTGKVVGVAQVLPGDGVILITQDGMIIRTAVDAIREIGRSTQGVRLINLDEGDKVSDVARVVIEDEAPVDGDALPEEDEA